MTDRFDLTADLPDASRANEEALRFIGDFQRAKSAKDVDATMRFFSREMVMYGDGTLGMAFPGWEAMRGAYASMMPNWGDGQSNPLMIWGAITGGNGSALVHVVDTPEMFGGEARIFASVDVRDGGIVRWVDYWDSGAFDDTAYAAMRQPDKPFPPDFGEAQVASSAPPRLASAVEALHAAVADGNAHALGEALHTDIVFEDVALGTTIRGTAAVVEYLTASDTSAPFANGAALRHVVGGEHGGGYEWRAANGRAGVTGVSIDSVGKVLRMVAVYDHRAFFGGATQ